MWMGVGGRGRMNGARARERERQRTSRTRKSYTSGARKMASGTPAALVSATACAAPTAFFENSVIGSTIGTGIETPASEGTWGAWGAG